MNQKTNQLVYLIKQSPVTSILIFINTIMLIITLVSGGFTSTNLVRLGGLVPVAVTELNEYYRVISSMFLHGSIIHFLLNMYALYMLGRNMEALIGPYKFILITIIGGLGASIAVVFFSPELSLTIGASGFIFAIIGALLLMTFTRKNWFHPKSINSIRYIVLINIGITFVIPNISIAGHIGGLIAGVLLILPLVPRIPYYIEKRNNII